MRGLKFKDGKLSSQNVPRPIASESEALIRVTEAGICATDLEIIKGYGNFTGILGHEFVGIVESCDTLPELIGERVVGEINAACGHCARCRQEMPRHCSDRTTLGISGRDGAFAEYLTLPAWNLHRVPEGMDDYVAVFTEPLAAAMEILEQVHLPPGTTVLLIGDGKLAQLIARVLARHLILVEVVGKSEAKVRRMKGFVTKGYLNSPPPGIQYPFVIEASGSPTGWKCAVRSVQPRGMIILKSAFTGSMNFNPAPLVVNEITVIGSRCGAFPPALKALQDGLLVTDLIDSELSFRDWDKAFARAAEPEALKVLLKMGNQA